MDRETRGGLRVLKLSLAAVIVVISATACGTTVSGTATPGTTPVDLTKLDYGLAPNEPSEFEFDPMLPNEIYAIEGRRMLEYLASPYEADPELRYLHETSLMTDSSMAFPDSFAPIAERNYLVASAATARDNGSVRNKRIATIVLMRLGNDSYARTAAREFDAELDVTSPGRQRIQLTEYPDARAAVTPGHDHAQAIATRGPYVVAVSISAPAGQASEMGDRIRRLLDVQFEAMRDLAPTPADDMLDLPTNPDGIMNIVLPNKYGGDGLNSVLNGTYSRNSHRHLEYDAGGLPDYSTFGVDLVARNGAIIYRTESVPKAFALQTALSQPGKYDEEIPGPPGIADARCVHRDYTFGFFESFYCVTVYDRFVALVDYYGAGDLPAPELYQATAAQYAILANSR